MNKYTKQTIEELKKDYPNLKVIGTVSFNWSGNGTSMSEDKEITLCRTFKTYKYPFIKIVYTHDEYYEGDWSDSNTNVEVFVSDANGSTRKLLHSWTF